MSIYEILKQNAENNNKVVDKITYTIKPSFTTRKLKQLQKENKQLKDNWNKLKEYINIMHEYYLYTDVNVIYRNNSIKNEKLGYPILCNLSELHSSDKVLSSIYKKMQELEKVDSNEI